jgi:hypothetical protein
MTWDDFQPLQTQLNNIKGLMACENANQPEAQAYHKKSARETPSSSHGKAGAADQDDATGSSPEVAADDKC